ncbi:MAG: hypothetical protein ACREL6_09765 [Gemmatimonadales bacterium]
MNQFPRYADPIEAMLANNAIYVPTQDEPLGLYMHNAVAVNLVNLALETFTEEDDAIEKRHGFLNWLKAQEAPLVWAAVYPVKAPEGVLNFRKPNTYDFLDTAHGAQYAPTQEEPMVFRMPGKVLAKLLELALEALAEEEATDPTDPADVAETEQFIEQRRGFLKWVREQEGPIYLGAYPVELADPNCNWPVGMGPGER